MPEKTIAIKLNIKNREAVNDMEEAVTSVPGFSISRNGSPCDVMVVEVGYDLDKEFKLVDEVRAKGMAKEVFLTSSRKDPEVLLKALKMGIKEFFPQPLVKEEFTASLEKFKASLKAESAERDKQKNGILISLIGSKGGVGATTAAVNLATSLQEMARDKSVVLLDMNPLLGGVNLFLDIKTSFSWVDGARDIARMDSTYLLNTLYKHPTGVYVMPAPSKPVGLESATPDTMARLVGLLRSAFDIIVVDSSKSFDDVSIRMLALSDTILVVSELNILSLVNAKRLLETFDGLGLSYGKDIRVVINRYQKKNMVSPGEAEKNLGKKIVSMIPNDYETTMSAINIGKSLSDVAWKSPVMEHFRALASLLLHKEVVKKEKSLFALNPFASWGKNSTD
jgi:pilus assembly protein CpaE